jgi:hypothetical protein
LGAFFCPLARAKKPGFPLQVLGFANANPAGFPLQSLAHAPAANCNHKNRMRIFARQKSALGVVSRLRRNKSKAPALRNSVL